MTPRCDVSSKTRGGQSRTPGVVVTRPGAFFRCCFFFFFFCYEGREGPQEARLLPAPRAGTWAPFAQCRTPALTAARHRHLTVKEQEAGSLFQPWHTRLCCFPAWQTPHALGDILQLKPDLFIPFPCGGWAASKEKVPNYQGRLPVRRLPSLGSRISETIRLETSWR